MTHDRTIIYYTSNRKNPAFTEKTKNVLIANCGDLPIISVSQKPLDLGKNICIGDVGFSYLNAFRQILIGAHEATSEYLVFAEDDFLYPPEYFNAPINHDLMRYDNVWMVLSRGLYYKTFPIGGAQIARRNYVIKELEYFLQGEPEWANIHDYRGPVTTRRILFLVHDVSIPTFAGPPAITFKPKGNLSGTGSIVGKKIGRLPIWGDVKELRSQFNMI